MQVVVVSPYMYYARLLGRLILLDKEARVDLASSFRDFCLV